MSSKPDPTPAPGGAAEAQRESRGRRFARRIECDGDGDGYSAAPRGPSRGGGMREPGAWRLAETCDVLLLVGTSGTVWPAAELPHVARRSGARVIEVNPDPSELTQIADLFLQGRAGEVLPRLAQAVARMK